ncbi:MAG: thermosome subunit alpha [Halobacteriota archaeon]
MAQQLGGQPLIVLSEESQRTSGRDAQSMNITAGRAVAESVRTTLGPKGMDKMLVDSSGEVVITNDGVTILKEMDIDHPAATMVVEVAESQEDEVGDGTTTAVVIAGELLKRAEELIEQDIHATTLTQGFRQAAGAVESFLREKATAVGPEDDEVLRQIAATAMTGKGAESAKDQLAELVVEAVQAVAEEDGINLDDVQIRTQAGGSIDDSSLIDGVIVGKSRVNENMPRWVTDANVAVLASALEFEETEVSAEVNVTDPDQLQEFIEQEKADVRAKVDALIDAGADVVFCGEAISDFAQHHLAQHDVLAVRRVSDDDLRNVARATGARIVHDIGGIEAEDLGYAGRVEEREVGDSDEIFVEDVEDGRAVALYLRGGTEHVIDEVERAIVDALGVVKVTLEDGAVLPGGGAPETALAMELRDLAESVGGREQLAVEAFADALEVIPRTLAENAGHDPIDSLVALRSAQDAGSFADGLDAYSGDVADMGEAGVYEPLRVKTQAVESATDAAVMILRIDDVIAAGDLAASTDDDDDEPAAGGPGGMGGMM